MYTDYKQMQSEIDSYIRPENKEGLERVRAEWLWMENQGAGRLEKRIEGGIEVEKFVISSVEGFLNATKTLQGYSKWRYGQQCRLEDLEKTNETM